MKHALLAVPLFALVALLSPQLASARSLTSGTSGSDVVALQNALIAKGYLAAGKNTGYFGSLTLAAVQNFNAKAILFVLLTALLATALLAHVLKHSLGSHSQQAVAPAAPAVAVWR